MALQSEVSPHLVGDPNKDTKNEGETKSDNESSSTDEDADLEEGEILDSGEEEEEKKDLTNSSLKEALDKNFLKSIEQLVSQAKTDVCPASTATKNISPHNSPIKIKKRSSKYLDHDRFENNSDQEDGWYSVSRKHKSSKFDTKPIDYRKELEAYRGTPPSSPDSKHREKRRKRSKKSKKSGKKTIKRKDIKGVRVSKYMKEAARHKICKFFKEGKCNKGADCGFSHANPLPRKKELCKFYLSGHCNKGKECLFMHGDFPCKFYHTGSDCYAQDACRFSHAPLTDETKRILADYLNISRGDEDFDRKRKKSPSPEPQRLPPAKRTCLLGSPPRHIREAEETKRWQEEMLLQQQNHPGFKIHISPSRDSSSPPPFTKPNFYKDTLLNSPSPKKRRSETSNPLSSSFPPQSSTSVGGFPMPNSMEPFSRGSPERYLYDDEVDDEEYQDMGDLNVKQESAEFSWTNMRGMDHSMPQVKNEMEPFVDAAQQDLDFTSDVKFDETTQFSEMESSTDCNLSSPPNSLPQVTVNKESEEESSNQENVKLEDKVIDDSSLPQQPVTSPILIPSHLPKKQQELLKRIVQHQKKNPVAASTSDVSNSPKSFDNSEPVKEIEDTNEKCEVEKSESALWYSSEEDDDDDTVEPLTDVLKKLQKEPPSASPPVKIESKPATSIMAMLNKCQQNTSEKKKGASEQGEFFKNLLLGTIPSSESLQLPGLNAPPVEHKRRTLLPDPQPAAQPAIKKEPIVTPKDPRLKNRDPRILASNVNNAFNLPKTNVVEQNISQTSSCLTSRELKTSLSSTTTSVITEPAKEDIPYKLHGIYTKPPNYTPYISASQTNPNLLKDPRLRKHLNLNQDNENGVENKKEADCIKNPAKNVPPVPQLLLEYHKDPLNINIFESHSAAKPLAEEAQDVKPTRPKLTDPRMRRRDSQNSSGSNTPPPLTIVDNSSPVNKVESAPILENEAKLSEEKKWLPSVLEKNRIPPVLEQSWTPTIKQEIDSDGDDERLEIDENPPQCSPVKLGNDNNDDSPVAVTKKVKPTPVSHLPRAITDPRMAKLHSPLDSRRPRVACTDFSNKNGVELKKVNNSSPKENSIDTSKISPTDSIVIESENGKSGKNVPKKDSSDKQGEKKKTVHRNRRSSMDYASPLNSCDDSNSNKSLNYNSYNKRPPRTSASHIVTDSSVSVKTANSVISEATPDFLSDNSNLECDNSDVNLKDMFKTIDPTASPFC